MSNRYLPTALRRALEKAVKDARIVAEEGARDSIRRLGVADSKAPNYLTDAEKELRRRLRAHARALGDVFERGADTQETKRLIEAAAYAHWHRMLFARFLAERNLLRHPEHNVPVSLEDCRELAEAEGLTDAWAVAERYSAAMLPAVFRTDDPVLALDLDPVHTQKLNQLVTTLDAEIFQADDSLGWTYQFWRAAEKDAINASGVKIGADELPAVTQLFTEPYMVRFLLHNTLGAWWACKVLASNPTLAQTASDEETLRTACALPGYDFDLLRFSKGEDEPWRPAAGTFSGWPKEAKAITMLDPCCGSGHFLTEALAILAALRKAEEGLPAADAVAAVLRDNLHGLEIDGRCVQIAAFATALTAWRIGGWRALPLPHIAWVGAPPPLPKREFVALADGDPELEYALAALHDLFAQAPILGSLLEPSGGDLFEAEKMREIERLLEPLLAMARRAEPEQIEGVVAARGMTDAAALLHRKYTLQSTNVPFLGRAKQENVLAEYISRVFPEAKADLATAMLKRMFRLATSGGTISAVSPQNWLFLGSYRNFREFVLHKASLNIVAVLGEKGFESAAAAGAFTCLVSISKFETQSGKFTGIDASDSSSPSQKAEFLKRGFTEILHQEDQKKNPDFRITIDQPSRTTALLEAFAESYQGIRTGDKDRFVLRFWEPKIDLKWEPYRNSSEKSDRFHGLSEVIRWEQGRGELHRYAEATREKLHDMHESGNKAWSRVGVAINQMRGLKASLYFGEKFDGNVSVIFAKNPNHTRHLIAYCISPAFHDDVRRIDKKIAVTNATLTKVPFEIDLWSEAAASIPDFAVVGPSSQDCTQWYFHGHPANAERGTTLHVALARLCGYRWPAEIVPDIPLSAEARDLIAKAATLPEGDNDCLLSVPAVAGEKALTDRLRAFLNAVFGKDWSDTLERRLIAEADETLDNKTARDSSLEAWLRDRAFRQHCALFGQRPFLWHISDGLKDGFSVFVHYHRFDQSALRKLTYTMLGDWLVRAKAEGNALRFEKGRELQQMLEKILEGEKPYDIFVRWKSLAQQPLGWDPDLDDGVRQNIRPFIQAGVLTCDLSRILKDKDRGNDIASAPWYPLFKGERINNHHTTLTEKQASREAVKKRVRTK